MRRRLHDHIHKSVPLRIIRNVLDHADRHAARKDLVAARRQHDLAGLDPLIANHVFHLRLPCRIAPQNAANAGCLQDDARAARLVVDRQHLRGVGKHVANLAHDPVGRDDRHVALNAVILALVDVKHTRLVGSAGSDGLCRNSLINVFFLKMQ